MADGMSRDGTRELVPGYAARRWRASRSIDNPRRITPAALNRAPRFPRRIVIVRLDAHSTVSPGYLQGGRVPGILRGFERRRRDAQRDPRPGLFAEPIRLALTSRFGVGNSHFRTR